MCVCVCTFAQLPARFQYTPCHALTAVDMKKDVLPEDQLNALQPALCLVAKQGRSANNKQQILGNLSALCVLGEASPATAVKPCTHLQLPT